MLTISLKAEENELETPKYNIFILKSPGLYKPQENTDTVEFFAFDEDNFKIVLKAFAGYHIFIKNIRELEGQKSELELKWAMTDRKANSYKELFNNTESKLKICQKDRNLIYNTLEEEMKDKETILKKEQVKNIFISSGVGIVGLAIGFIIGFIVF